MCPLCITTAALVAAGGTSGAGVLGFGAVKFRSWRRLRNRSVSPRRAVNFPKQPPVEEAAEPMSGWESIGEPKLVATRDGYEQHLSELGKWCRENGRPDLATVFDDAQILERYENGQPCRPQLPEARMATPAELTLPLLTRSLNPVTSSRLST
jgi:hypothetical protein